jgi:hypothetical protein
MQQGNPGNMAAGLSAVRNAIEMLQKALQAIPLGSPLHSDVLGAVSKLSKHTETGNSPTPSMDLQQMIQAARGQAQQAPMAALQRMFPQGQNAPPAGIGGGGPPVMPSGGPPPGGAGG